MTYVSALPTIMLEPLVRAALLEDLGRAGIVDLIAVGLLTHSAPILDIGLDYREA